MTTVWIYVDTNKEVGDVDHLKEWQPVAAEGYSPPATGTAPSRSHPPACRAGAEGRRAMTLPFRGIAFVRLFRLDLAVGMMKNAPRQ